METLRDNWPYAGRRAVKRLKIIVVGAGIGGLSAGIALSQTGHSVTILESVSEISEVGAGIQLAPNASRILHRLGVLKDVMDDATVLTRISIRRYASDDEMSTSPMMPSSGLKYGAPMSVIHRADLQRVLLSAAKKSGCRILTSHTVLAADPRFSARVRVHNTKTRKVSWLSGDMVIAADGIKSTLRRQMALANDYKDRPIPTGDAAYRLLIPREKIQHDPVLLEMLDQNVAMRYMGPGGHIMAYPVKKNTMYNMVLLHPAKPSQMAGTNDSWTSKGNRKEMLGFYGSWSPAIRKWLEHADEQVLEWSLYVYPKIPKWVQGSIALIGDACHPMLPYVAQGAANAIEDAAVLATALTCTSDVQVALHLYEAVRKQRGEKIAASASATAKTLHLPDGPEQRERDAAIMNPNDGRGNPDQWANLKWQDYMWGVDVMAETMDNWNELVKKSKLARRHWSVRKWYSNTMSLELPLRWPLSHVNANETRLMPSKKQTIGVTKTRIIQAEKPVITEDVTILPPAIQAPAWNPSSWRSKPIQQGPSYADHAKLSSAVKQLTSLPPIVHPSEILALKTQLRDVAQGKAFLLQGGDCAEMFEYCQEDTIESKITLLHQMSVILGWGSNKNIVRIGRIAGQYAKPRSSPTETIDGKEVPSFRGDILNGHDADEREIDPDRLVRAYHHSAATLNYIRTALSSGITELPIDWNLDHIRDPELKKRYTAITTNIQQTLNSQQAEERPMQVNASKLYTSHEGLLLEYEQALTRLLAKPLASRSGTSSPVTAPVQDVGGGSGGFYNTSAHFIWIGDRTRQIDHAHVEFFRGIVNPVGIKIGPTTVASDIITLLRTLNPSREPGKITLITRYGASKVGSLLPKHIRAVEDSEYRRCVIWQCDPMHGNTISTPTGIKTRRFNDIHQELQETLRVHKEEGSYLGGVHLELAGDAVTECLGGSEELSEDDLSTNYKSFCDPRLNEKQAIELAFLLASHLSQEKKRSA